MKWQIVGKDFYTLTSLSGRRIRWESATAVKGNLRSWISSHESGERIHWFKISQEEFANQARDATLDPHRSGVAEITFEGNRGVSTPCAIITWARSADRYLVAEQFIDRNEVRSPAYYIGTPETEENRYNEIASKVSERLKDEKDNCAYERSMFYVLNAVRRGAILKEIGNEFVVLAKEYDRAESESLIFFSDPKILTDERLMNWLKKRGKDLFIHHLFKRTAKRMASPWEGGLVMDSQNLRDTRAYPPENTHPQVIYSLQSLPKHGESVFGKQGHLRELLNGGRGSDFKKSILEYLNATKKDWNEPEELTFILDAGMPPEVRLLVNRIVAKVLEGWSTEKRNPGFSEYQLTPIQNLYSLLRDPLLSQTCASTIIMKAHFDLKLEKGGFWIAEFIPRKSLLIPHIIVTDYHYREQYKFLLFDILQYAYLKNIDFVNLGGSEEKELYELKKLPEEMFAKADERPLYTAYLPQTRGM